MHGAAKLNWITEWLVAAAVGAGLLWLAALLVAPAAAPFPGHGERFAAMALDPLAFEGAFPQRILWPLLAWLFGFLGIGAVGFSQLCSGALLAVVFWFSRRRAGNLPDALLVTVAIALSGAVLVYQPMACFSDSLNLLLLVLLVHFAARCWVFWSLVLLSALSHELVFFFWPWLLYLRCQNGGAWRREVVVLAVVLMAYLAFRAPLGGSYGIDYYIENSIWVPWALPAMWALWAFLILVEFGPLLVVAVWAWRSGCLSLPATLGGRWGTLLYMAGLVPLMMLAYDVMRFATFAFLPVLLASLAFVRVPNGRRMFAMALIAAVGSYAWLHPHAGQQGGVHFTEVSGHINALLPLLVSRTIGDAGTFMWELLLRTWPIALTGLAAAAGVVALGIWTAHRIPREGTEPGPDCSLRG